MVAEEKTMMSGNADYDMHAEVVGEALSLYVFHVFRDELLYGIETKREYLNKLADRLEAAGYVGEDSGSQGSDSYPYTVTFKHPALEGHVMIKEIPYYDHLGIVRVVV